MNRHARHRCCALAVFLFGCWITTALGQAPRELANDTARIARLLQQADEHMRLWKLESAAQSVEQALAISDKLVADPSLILDAMLHKRAIALRARCFQLMGSARPGDGPLEEFAEALRLYEQVRDSTGMAMTYAAIAGAHQWKSNYGASVSNYRKALRMLKAMGEDQQYADVLNDLGVVYRNVGDLSAALACHLEALPIIERSGSAARSGWNYVLIGAVHRSNKAWPKALTYFELARRQYLRSGDEAGIATSYNDLGTANYGAGNLDSALAWHRKAAAVRERIGELNGLAGSQQYIGDILRGKGRTEEALQSYRSSLASFARVPNPQGMASAYRAIANVMNANGDHDGALEQLRIALALMVDFSRKNEVPQTYYLIAAVHARAGARSAAVAAYEQGIAVANELGDRQAVMAGYKALFELHQLAGDDRNAYLEHRHYLAARDSVRAITKGPELMRLTLRYDLEQLKLREDAEDEAQRAQQQFEVDRQRQQKNMYLAGGALFALLSIGLMGRLRYNTRTRNRLETQRRDLQRATARAESSEKFKERFLANMSHEIRTPMNAIMGMTGILQRSEHLPLQRPQLDAIAHNADGLLRILNDILDLSKLDAGMLQLESMTLDPRAVVEQVLVARREKAAAKGIELVGEAAAEVQRHVMGDPTRLEQIVANLVDNAIKFTERGSVHVAIRTAGSEQGGTELDFIVRDTGPGIPADRLEKIFEEFTKAYSDGTRKYGGTGLGLTISKRLAEHMGGALSVVSEEGKGSTFTARVPFTPVSRDAENALRDRPAQMALLDLRILLAEDNEFNVMVAQDELADAIPGVQVDVAVNGRIAVEMAQANNYDLILMDVQMPEMNGYDATKAIKALLGPEISGPNKSRVPIIAMTANVMKEEIDRCREAGMTGHIPKPFTRQELLAAINAAVRI